MDAVKKDAQQLADVRGAALHVFDSERQVGADHDTMARITLSTLSRNSHTNKHIYP